MPTLGKQEIVKQLSEKTGSSQKDAETHLNAFLDLVRDAMHQNDEIRLVGFGSFSVQETAAREGVNPQTHQKMHIPAGKRVKFSPGKELQDAVAPATKSGKK
jgi:DNA-binding protein HU-beta